MTSYAIALDKEIAMLNEKMSKLQKEKKEEETLKEKEIQKEEDNKKRKEEMSKEFAEYDDMMIIQKIYPKFFTITAYWDLKVKNPEYVEYFNKTLKLIKECDIDFLNKERYQSLNIDILFNCDISKCDSILLFSLFLCFFVRFPHHIFSPSFAYLSTTFDISHLF